MGIGLIGAFTTIAALSTENLALLQQGRYGMFALYLGITVFATFGAAYAGKRLADAMGPRYSAYHQIAAPRESAHHQVAAPCDSAQHQVAGPQADSPQNEGEAR